MFNHHVLVIGAGNDRNGFFKTLLENRIQITYVGATYYNNYSHLVHRAIFFDTHDPNMWQGLVSELEEIHNTNPFHAVITLSELDVESASFLAKRFDLPHLDEEAARICRNKYKMRQKLSRDDIPSPLFNKVEKQEEVYAFAERIGYPLILKPTDNGGSVGVTRIHSRDEIDSKYEEVCRSSLNGELIAEQYIAGEEYSVEVIVQHQSVQVIAVVDKQVHSDAGYFVEVGHTLPSLALETTQNTLRKIAIQAVKSVGIDHGLAHVEIKQQNDGEFYVMEIGARAAGDLIPDLINYSYGWNYYKAVVDIALGKHYEPLPDTNSRYATIQFMLGRSSHYVRGFPQMDTKNPGIKDIKYNIRTGDQVKPIKANYSRLGHVMYVSDDKESLRDCDILCQKFSPILKQTDSSEEKEFSSES
ncbi:ATP-grasp domain-containing protein [Virgibacillus xinjiangensis]|uniref:ATP-grasp domain-containing protein n=1 Tax=Virgibacillus xinjiangensis TaxID=393090 RepID=A0ABV7CTG2_9BACI